MRGKIELFGVNSLITMLAATGRQAVMRVARAV
jgi:predicted XRE-type DNA-binding protein